MKDQNGKSAFLTKKKINTKKPRGKSQISGLSRLFQGKIFSDFPTFPDFSGAQQLDNNPVNLTYTVRSR